MNILVVCMGGISTSFLVNRMREVLKAKNIKGEINASGGTLLTRNIDELDVVLVAPQAECFLGRIREICESHQVPYGLIDSKYYGTFDGEKVLDFAISLINQ